MTEGMTINELHSKILTAKRFLNAERVRLKTNTGVTNLALREINDRMDMIHEVERIGYRNLNDRETRKITRMLAILEVEAASQN